MVVLATLFGMSLAVGAAAAPLRPRKDGIEVDMPNRSLYYNGDRFKFTAFDGVAADPNAAYPEDILAVAMGALCLGIKDGNPSTNPADYKIKKGESSVDLGLAWESAGPQGEDWPKVGGGWKATLTANHMYNNQTLHDPWVFFIQDKDLTLDHCVNGFTSALFLLTNLFRSNDNYRPGNGVSLDRAEGSEEAVGKYEIWAVKY